MAAISQTTFSNAFSWMKSFVFWLSLNFVPEVPIDNKPASVQIMAWRRPGDKPLSEPMKVNLLTHICVTRPRWIKQGMSFWRPFLRLYYPCPYIYSLYSSQVNATHLKIASAREYFLRVLDLQMSCSDLTTWQGTRPHIPAIIWNPYFMPHDDWYLKLWHMNGYDFKIYLLQNFVYKWVRKMLLSKCKHLNDIFTVIIYFDFL